ncbi:lysophospholipid acyltransferase family protein [Geminicoccus flavidas]|uniref:lysophospholipid acyltransferase family protein n=1 Tax=Geminicoccus flavidas TaxID=2506407 RepID=UPI001356ED2B|nr:1-acyl-sn-glycerol-3-phosphate acyltransferase [Geminicoccus flavidas]
MSVLRFCLRVVGFVLILATALLVRLLAPTLRLDGQRLARVLWCRGCLALLNVRVGRAGLAAPGGPTLFVANHVSWLDILVLGGQIDGVFVAKSEVAGWPLFGSLARLARTIFIERHWRAARAQCRLLAGKLRGRDDLILFPEGTSSAGRDVLPFKTSLFAAAAPEPFGAGAQVQPVTLAYLGLSAGGTACPERYAWHGDQLFLPHLCQVLADRGCRVELVFHPPCRVADLQGRKAAATAAHRVIAAELTKRRAEAPVGAAQGVAPPLAGEPAAG